MLKNVGLGTEHWGGGTQLILSHILCKNYYFITILRLAAISSWISEKQPLFNSMTVKLTEKKIFDEGFYQRLSEKSK